MPEDRLAERLAQARRLASETRLDRLEEVLAGLRADAVTDGGVPADLEVELAVIRASALLNLERPTEAWEGLQVVHGRLEERGEGAGVQPVRPGLAEGLRVGVQQVGPLSVHGGSVAPASQAGPVPTARVGRHSFGGSEQGTPGLLVRIPGIPT